MIKIQKTIDGKVYDFWKYTEEEILKMKAESEKAKAEREARKAKVDSLK